MYNNTSKPIDTRIGTGEAVVRDKGFIDLTTLGQSLGYNSKEGQRRRRTKKVQDAYGEFEEDRSGLTQAQLEVYNPVLEDLKNFARDPEAQKDPKFFESFTDKMKNAVAIGEQFRTQAKNYNGMYSGLQKDSEIDLYENIDGFKSASAREFAYDENGELKDPATLMAETKIAMNDLQKRAISDYRNLIPDDLAVGKEDGTPTKSGNVIKTPSSTKLTEEGIKRVKGTGKQSVINYFEGKARDRDQINLVEAAMAKLENENAVLYDSYIEKDGTWTEGGVKALAETAGNILLDDARAQYEKDDVKQTYQRPLAGRAGPKDEDPNNYKVTKETVPTSIYTDKSGDIPAGMIQREVAAVKPIKTVITDSEGSKVQGTITKVSYDQDGNKIAIVTVPLKTSSGDYSRSKVEERSVPYDEVTGSIDGVNQELHDAMFDQMDSKGNTYEGYTEEQSREIYNLVGSLIEDYDADTNQELANKLFGEGTKVEDPWGPSDFEVTVDGETKSFNMDDEDSRDELIKFALEKKYGKPKKARESSSEEKKKIKDSLGLGLGTE